MQDPERGALTGVRARFDTKRPRADNEGLRMEEQAMDQALGAVLSELRRRLQDLYGERLSRVVLYGSQARGEGLAGSDVDVLIVLRGDVSACVEIGRTCALVADLSLQHGVAIVPSFISEDRYETEQSPLLLNVRREGVPI